MKYYLLILSFLSVSLFAQTDEPYTIGAVFGINRVWNVTEMPVIPGADDCGLYRNGQATGYNLGVELGYNYNKYFTFNARAIYDRRPATLYEENQNYEVLDPRTNSYVPLVRAYDFTSELAYLAIDLGVKVRPIPELPIYSRVSFDAGEAIFNSDAQNTETILSPEGVLYPDLTRRLFIEQGNLDDLGTAMGASLAIGADFMLKNKIRISPEISYRYSINSIRANSNWNQNIVRLNLIASWDFGKKEQIPPREKEIEIIEEVIPEEKPVIVEKIIKSAKTNGIKLQETVVTQTYPILPYLFFDENSSKLKSEYTKHTRTFIESELPKDNLQIYYKMLDIIGKRLKENPELTIEVIGVTDGGEQNTRQGRIELATKRAESVSEYLFENWELSPEQIVISGNEFPTLATNPAYKEGYEENRRVEFESKYPQVFEPVVHSKFLEYNSLSESIDSEIELNSGNELSRWIIFIKTSSGKFIQSFTGNSIEDYKKILIPNDFLLLLQNELREGNKSFVAEIEVTTKSGKTERTTIDFPVEIEKNSYELGRLNLIVFDFDRSEITKQNESMLQKFISTSIKDNSTISILGSTDRLGEAAYNKSLSLARAESVKSYLLNIKPNAKVTSVKGIGNENLLFDNSLPEGRFYCRTVLIEVKTPLAK